jgi:ketosteroid isomerase-like protein
VQSINDFCREWSAAECAGDAGSLARMVADDFVGVGPLGFTLDKAQWLDRHRTGDLRYDSFELHDLQPRLRYAAAVITASLDARGAYKGQTTPQSLRTTLVLVPRGDAWQLVGVHHSFIAGSPGAPPLPLQTSAGASG